MLTYKFSPVEEALAVLCVTNQLRPDGATAKQRRRVAQDPEAVPAAKRDGLTKLLFRSFVLAVSLA